MERSTWSLLHKANFSKKKLINENLVFEKNKEKRFWYLVLRDVVMGELRALVVVLSQFPSEDNNPE